MRGDDSGARDAIDMHSGHVKWRVPLGTTEDLAPFSEYFVGKSGTPNLGGPIVTAGGVVFIAAGGHSKLDTKRGDQILAFALPR